MGQDNKNKVEVYQAEEAPHIKIERLDSATHLIEGMFLQFKETPDQSQSSRYSELVKGDILLVEKLHFADGNLHSVTLKDHPRNADGKSNTTSFKFLFEKLHENFNFLTQAEGQLIREKELAALNAKIEHKQKEYSDLEQNPEKLNALSLQIYSRRIGSPTAPLFTGGINNVVDLLGSSNATEQIEHYSAGMGMAKDLVQIQLQYLQNISSEILELSKKVMPYVMERMITSISSMEEKKVQFEKMNDSVASMQLYTGVGVEVDTIRTGNSADRAEPLTLMQERLFADAELSYFNATHAEHLDASSVGDDFFTALVTNDDLVNQIFPTQRCVCVMAIREKDIDYKDSLYNLIMNQMNKTVFLLIRDGENISAVYSPIGSHLAAKNLFPSKDSLDKHFFTHSDIEITPESLDYAKATSKADKETLHYKRFLILIAGLQHRLNLFGTFYPDNQLFNIFNVGFQNNYFRYIHDADGEGLLSDGHTQSLMSWVMQKNKTLHKGSTLLCDNKAMTIYHVAAGCFRWSHYNKSNDGYRQIKGPVEDFSVVNCQRNKDGQFFVKLKCSNENFTYDFDQKAHVVDTVYFLAEGESALGYFDNRIPYLVLDNISAVELEFYCSQRRFRKEYLSYMRLFKAAMAHLKEAEAANLNDIQYFKSAVGNIQDTPFKEHEVLSMINDAIALFNGKKSRTSILNYLYTCLNVKGNNNIKARVLEFSESISDQGFSPIALTIDNNGTFFVYTNILADDYLEQITPHFWMNRFALIQKKNQFHWELRNEKVSFDDFRREERLICVFNQERYDHYYKNTSWSHMQINYQNGGVEERYSGLFHTYAQKKKMLDAAQYSVELLKKIVTNTVDRQTVEFLKSAVSGNYYSHRLRLFVGFKEGHPLLNIHFTNSMKWLNSLFDKYQNAPGVDLIEQDNSELNYYFETSNMFHDWTIKRNIIENDSDRTELANYSSRSIGYAYKKHIAEHHSAIRYFVFSTYTNTLFGIDEFLGNTNIVQPVIQLGLLNGSIHVVKKNDYSNLEHKECIIVAEQPKLEEMKLLLEDKLNGLKDKWDLQRNRVDVSISVSKHFVIHAEDYNYLVKQRYPRSSIPPVEWSSKFECYMNDETMELLDPDNVIVEK